MEWISVKDRLPEEPEIYVLAYGIAGNMNQHDVYSVRYHSFSNEFIESDCCGDTITDVTYWMPFPTGPEKETLQKLSND